MVLFFHPLHFAFCMPQPSATTIRSSSLSTLPSTLRTLLCYLNNVDCRMGDFQPHDYLLLSNGS